MHISLMRENNNLKAHNDRVTTACSVYTTLPLFTLGSYSF